VSAPARASRAARAAAASASTLDRVVFACFDARTLDAYVDALR
jgi:hypothetical protein